MEVDFSEHADLMQMSTDELLHYGVMGMHWGIRRYQPYSTRGRKSGKKGKEIGDAKRHLKRILNEPRVRYLAEKNRKKQLAENKARQEKEFNDNFFKEHKDEILRSGDPNTITKFRNYMSDSEFTGAYNRAKTQMEVAKMAAQLNRDPKKEFVKAKAKELGTKAVTELSNTAINALKKQLEDSLSPSQTKKLDIGKEIAKVNQAKQLTELDYNDKEIAKMLEIQERTVSKLRQEYEDEKKRKKKEDKKDD